MPNERLGEAAVLAIVDRLTRLIREVFPGKTLSLVPLKQFRNPRQCPARWESNSSKMWRSDLQPRAALAAGQVPGGALHGD